MSQESYHQLVNGMENSQSVKDKEKASNSSMEGQEEGTVLEEEKGRETILPAEKARLSSSGTGGMDLFNEKCGVEESQMVKATGNDSRQEGELKSSRAMKRPMEMSSLGAEKASSSSGPSGMKAEKVSGSSSVQMQEETQSVNPLKGEWVVEMDKKLSYTDDSSHRWAKHCIFRVPKWIKNMTNSDAYRPWLVSLGPYHHDDSNLKPMEEHKRRAVSAVTRRMPMGHKNALIELASVVDKKANFLLNVYDDLGEYWGHNVGQFKEMMLTDGCFLLEIIRVFSLVTKGKECQYYETNDPVFSMRGFLSLYLALKADVIMMENQLPLFLLIELEEKITGKTLVRIYYPSFGFHLECKCLVFM